MAQFRVKASVEWTEIRREEFVVEAADQGEADEKAEEYLYNEFSSADDYWISSIEVVESK